ncbi:cellulose binding domain-containing protein [Micromonospora sp. DR5-3]|uniref:cellulose binding domain-containing protein n=1 Tax=unclassified Micromonospora TaxID=2617518 RepID=UPI0011D92F78|nr:MULTISPECIES: cellulose binding domain-containing protein [unclassified Micromonospora]MCW3814800.1 cellulose binding domain-containing protein [Micromonospora sp. DR5-3]TYC24127.1 chitinase [Micromonospora sp. MP36]
MRLRSARVATFAAAFAAALIATTVVAAPPASAATATFVRVTSWDTGYEAKFTVTNDSPASISSWNVQFDLPAGSTVGAFWDALLTTSGQHVTAVNQSWNGTLAPGASTTFGFNVNGTGNPTNCTVNGGPCTGGGTPGTPATPGGLRVTGTTNTSVSLAWNAVSGTVTGYRVYEGTSVKATVTGASATVSGLAACSAHSYTVTAYNANGESAKSAAVSASTTGCTGGGGAMAAAPYLYPGWGDPPAPSTVMGATGIKWFTIAFVLSSGGCTPAWDGSGPLTGGAHANTIAAIRAAGGDVIPSFGGWSGNKLGPNCSSASALAGAYQQVINAYGLKAIDIDIENSDEFENEVVQDRILGALKIVKQNNPGIRTIVTFGTTTSGPSWWGTRLINQAAALGANIDTFTIMPFDFGGGANMYQSTVNAAEGLKGALKAAFGWSDATAYAHMGISGMNGLSDQQELTSPATWTQIRDWAKARGLSRFTFWSVNRDRACPGGGVVSNCSGIAQNTWEFTSITARY